MNQRDLEYFVKVVETGSFSQASILLGIAQPAISRHVKELESELRINLLYRNGRGVVLTEAGERLYGRATAILDQMAEARSEALSLSGTGIQNATVGMPPSVSRILTGPLAHTLYQAYPDAKLRFIEAFNGHLLEWLTAGRLDAAVVYATDATQRLNADPLFTEKLCLISALGSPDAAPEIDAIHISKLPLVLPSRPHGLRHQLELWAAKNGIELNIRAECDAFCSLLQLVRQGLGHTIFSEAALQEEIERGTLARSAIVGPAPVRTLVLTVPANRPVTCGLTEFSRMIKQVVRTTAPSVDWLPASTTGA